jgi:putative transcriptional regulator
MTKSAFEKMAAGLDDARRYLEGESAGFTVHIPKRVDVKAIRQRLKLSQPKFAETFGFSVGRVRDWEQGRFEVDAPSRVFLTVLDREPEAVLRALGTKPRTAGTKTSTPSRQKLA